eukprot:scaffold1785_cov247-Pinguiococcus_pyrenoidosus.AAC.4
MGSVSPVLEISVMPAMLRNSCGLGHIGSGVVHSMYASRATRPAQRMAVDALQPESRPQDWSAESFRPMSGNRLQSSLTG